MQYTKKSLVKLRALSASVVKNAYYFEVIAGDKLVHVMYDFIANLIKTDDFWQSSKQRGCFRENLLQKPKAGRE